MSETLSTLYTTEYFRFVLTLMLSFLTGLEMRGYRNSLERAYFIGTVRTYTFIGMLGYILYVLDPSWRFYLAGFGLLVLLFALFYYRKLMSDQKGIISLLVATLVYTYAPMIMTQPLWFTAMVFVSIVFIVNAKARVHYFTTVVDNAELITFAKLVLLSAVIWPLLPHTPISEWIPMSFSKIWLAVVVVSSISYIGYILQRYFFHERGFLINGVVGGIYSSTATTIVLAKQSERLKSHRNIFVSAIVLATGMMYLRLMAIIGFLNFALFESLMLPLGIIGLFALGVGYAISRLSTDHPETQNNEQSHINPMELGVAMVFALMFVVMSLVTHYFITNYGVSGLNILSFVIGFTDIDPFILSLVNGSYPITQNAVASAILLAVGSNNFFKGFSALILGSKEVGRMSFAALAVLSAVTFACAFWIAGV